MRECRVSSAAIKVTSFKTRKARIVISSRLPMGVGTIYRVCFDITIHFRQKDYTVQLLEAALRVAVNNTELDELFNCIFSHIKRIDKAR